MRIGNRWRSPPFGLRRPPALIRLARRSQIRRATIAPATTNFARLHFVPPQRLRARAREATKTAVHWSFTKPSAKIRPWQKSSTREGTRRDWSLFAGGRFRRHGLSVGTDWPRSEPGIAGGRWHRSR